MDLALKNKIAVITGGASGIGYACAQVLIDNGAKIILADRNARLGAEAAQNLGAHYMPLDVSDTTAVTSVMTEIAEQFGHIDILVTSAGVLQRTLTPAELSWDEWDRVQKIHLKGTYCCCKEAGAHMIKQGSGAIITISSVAGLRPGPLHSYGPAKAAIISLTESLAGEWGRLGVRVNSVAPGFTETPALAVGIESGALTADKMCNANAFERLVKPKEVANAVAFLASEAASGITGATLPVDAGYLVSTSWIAYDRPPSA